MTFNQKASINYGGVVDYLTSFLHGSLHHKQIESISQATLGILAGATVVVTAIGQAIAKVRGVTARHAIKQVDRLLSNENITVWEIFSRWVPYVLGRLKDIRVAIDWTDFDADGHTTLSLNLVTRHGRATPMLWITVHKDELKDNRNGYEDACLTRLAEVLPHGVKVTILADRGFGDSKLFDFLKELGFSYIIRFRGNIHVTSADGETREAKDWIGKGGRSRKLRYARITAIQYQVGAVVCVHAKGMKEPWCLVASDLEATACQITSFYARRWTIEPYFRDVKDFKFGMGMSEIRIFNPERRDRLILAAAFAIYLLIILGEACESIGMDKQLRTSTRQRRTHSLFHQGCLLVDLMPNMPDSRLRPLIEKFLEIAQLLRVPSSTFSPA